MNHIDESKRLALRKMLEDMGIISNEPKYFSPEDMMQAFTQISSTPEFRALIKKQGLKHPKLKCPRKDCIAEVVQYTTDKNWKTFCSLGCKRQYLKNEWFVYNQAELDTINNALARGNIAPAVDLVAQRTKTSKVYGTCMYLAEESNTGYATVKALGPSTKAYMVFPILKAAGIHLKAR